MNKKQRKRIKRIVVSLILFVILFIMEHSGALSGINAFIVFILYFVPYLIVGSDVILKACKNIKNGQVFDENFLMTIATAAAFGLGVFGDAKYEEALAVMLFYQIGEAFQDYAVGKSRASIAEMMDIAPEYAYIANGDAVDEVDPEDVKIDDIIVIRPGDKVPLDGIVIDGEAYLDTSALTGESVPRRIAVGDEIISGCINGESTLKARVTKEYDDSTVARILELVENASAKKAVLENFVTRFARIYTPIVTVCALLLAISFPLFMGIPWSEGIKRACNFLIVSCPCALVISVPLGFFGGIGAASRIGVLVKGSNYLEAVSRLKILAFDKTGTLTKGEFKVSSINPVAGVSKDELMELAAYGEAYATHPIGKSILESYSDKIDFNRISDAKNLSGRGTALKLDNKELLVGNIKLIDENNIRHDIADGEGTITAVAYDGHFAGYIVVSDSPKDSAKSIIDEVKKLGIKETVMLTGDIEKTAQHIAKQIKIDSVYSELLPGDKLNKIEELIDNKADTNDTIGYVGDGINDAPVLMRADVGIAMGTLGADAAIEAADIVLMDDDLKKLPEIIAIARKTMTIVKSNIAFALGVKILILVLSALGLASMWAAVFGDVGVSIICILNSMRALSYKYKFD